MKITRRQLAGALAAGALDSAARAGESPEDLRKQIQDDLRQNAAKIAKTPLPMNVEPAFSFKA
jgi:hypothetical protein